MTSTVVFPNASTHLILRDTALRPSDDSPFVNEIFDDDRITRSFISQQQPGKPPSPRTNPPTTASSARNCSRRSTTISTRANPRTRPPEVETPHSPLQRPRRTRRHPPEQAHQRHPQKSPQHQHHSVRPLYQTTLTLDLLVYATGYTRDTHNELLKDCQIINASSSGEWKVRRDYSVKLDGGFVEDDVSIFLQGCNEAHAWAER